jgi:hypothetical protein
VNSGRQPPLPSLRSYIYADHVQQQHFLAMGELPKAKPPLSSASPQLSTETGLRAEISALQGSCGTIDPRRANLVVPSQQ